MTTATLITHEGKEITFNPAFVAVVADHNDATGEPGTWVYGVLNNPVMTGETVHAFLTRLHVAKSFAQLTRPNGWLVWINANLVMSVRTPSAGEYPGSVGAVISVGTMTQAVTETLEHVRTALDHCKTKA
jgi:hypothetical protein